MIVEITQEKTKINSTYLIKSMNNIMNHQYKLKKLKLKSYQMTDNNHQMNHNMKIDKLTSV